MKLQNKSFVVLVEDLYEDQELWYPVRRLTEAGAQVTIVGPKPETTYTSKHGYPAKSEKAADRISPVDFEGIIVPGGYAPDRMRRHKGMVELVREAFQSGKIVAAICHGGWLLCSAKILKGKKVTSFSSIRDDIEHAGATWVDEEVVQDGNLITSRTPDDLPAFLRTIIAACEEETEQKGAR
ncbi:MAG: type 1 glutamine amidotransferase domain-containing protein [Planctomycetota bacterium]